MIRMIALQFRCLLKKIRFDNTESTSQTVTIVWGWVAAAPLLWGMYSSGLHSPHYSLLPYNKLATLFPPWPLETFEFASPGLRKCVSLFTKFGERGGLPLEFLYFSLLSSPSLPRESSPCLSHHHLQNHHPALRCALLLSLSHTAARVPILKWISGYDNPLKPCSVFLLP